MSRRRYWQMVSWLVLTCAMLAVAAVAGEHSDKGKGEKRKKSAKKIALQEAPAAVQQAIAKEAGKAVVRKVKVRERGGKAVYKAEWRIEGGEVEVKVSAAGKVLEREEERELTLDQLPAAVKEAVLKAAGEHPVTEVEQVTKNGAVVYEAEWKDGGREVEIKVDPKGNVLKQEIEDDDDDDEEGEHHGHHDNDDDDDDHED